MTHRVISYDQVTTQKSSVMTNWMTYRVISYNQVASHRVVSYDLPMTHLSSLKDLTDDSDNLPDDKLRPDFFGHD